MVVSRTALAAARALLDRAVRDRANAYGGSLALGDGWEDYLLPRVPALVGKSLPDGALLQAARSFGADPAIALECSARGLRQPDFLFLIARDGATGIAGADAKLGLDTVDAAQIGAETTARILAEGGPLAQGIIAALAPPETPAIDGYILTPQRVLNDLVLDGARPNGMPRPRLPEQSHIVTIALRGAELLRAVTTGPFARALVEGTDEAIEADASVDVAVLVVLATHLLLGMWREGETPLVIGRIAIEPPAPAQYAVALDWGRARVLRAGSAWEAAVQAANRARPRVEARARVQEALQPPLADPEVRDALNGARGKPGRIARAAAAEAYRTALLAALPPNVPDRGDALLDAIQTARYREMDALRARTIAAIHAAIRRTETLAPAEEAPSAAS
ncbi:MAG: hypothetical protein ACYDAR_14865 [Thermomicrobiales bacterium]